MKNIITRANTAPTDNLQPTVLEPVIIDLDGVICEFPQTHPIERLRHPIDASLGLGRVPVIQAPGWNWGHRPQHERAMRRREATS